MGDPHAATLCLLFAYGTLLQKRRPRSVRRTWPDRVRGDLYDLGDYPGAIAVGDSPRWIEGTVLEIELQELEERLDIYEGVAVGLYRRIRVVTERGHEVWVYEYAKPIRAGTPGPLPRWKAAD